MWKKPVCSEMVEWRFLKSRNWPSGESIPRFRRERFDWRFSQFWDFSKAEQRRLSITIFSSLSVSQPQDLESVTWCGFGCFRWRCLWARKGEKVKYLCALWYLIDRKRFLDYFLRARAPETENWVKKVELKATTLWGQKKLRKASHYYFSVSEICSASTTL